MKLVIFICTFIMSQNFCFALTPKTLESRAGHTVTELQNGDVLVAGGAIGFTKTLASSEIYNSKSNKWVNVAPLKISRSSHTATRLLNGKILVTGGCSYQNYEGQTDCSLDSSELYDPNLDKWTDVSPMNYARFSHFAELLPDGQVLIVGGASSSDQPAEIYDPQTDTWTIVNMVKPKISETLKVVSLKNGNFLFLSANLGNNKSYAQIYDFKKNTFDNIDAGEGRTAYDAVLLSDGRVLIAGGRTTDIAITKSVEIYDPILNTWSHATPMIDGHSFHSMTVLPNGKVLVAGGRTIIEDDNGMKYILETVNSEVYDPKLDTWEKVGPLRNKRAVHKASLLTNGHVLVVGGYADFNEISTCEIFNPLTSSWQ